MKIELNEFLKTYRESLGDEFAIKMFDCAMASGRCKEPNCSLNDFGCSGDGCLLNFADKDVLYR